MIAVEVVSPSQTMLELGVKAQFYRAVGVAEVWLIDPATRSVEIWSDSGKTMLDATQTLTTPLLAGFGVTIGSLMR